MKNLYKIFASLFLIAGLSGVIISCDKTVTEPIKEAYTPNSLDEKAGTWKTYILTSPTDVAVAVPKATTDAAYLKELDSLKNKILPTVSSTNKDAVAYWGAGAVYRWNEIARELAARYNLAPAYKEELGKYPVPDATNPLADPKFPFANPPYTARALAYLSVAQYDALVSAWNYKYKYNRLKLLKTMRSWYH